MNIRPLGDRVLVEPIEEKEQTVGGIIIPDSAKEKPMQGKVIAVGKKLDKDGKEIKFDVKKGRHGPAAEVRRHRGQARRQEAAACPRGGPPWSYREVNSSSHKGRKDRIRREEGRHRSSAEVRRHGSEARRQEAAARQGRGSSRSHRKVKKGKINHG